MISQEREYMYMCVCAQADLPWSMVYSVALLEAEEKVQGLVGTWDEEQTNSTVEHHTVEHHTVEHHTVEHHTVEHHTVYMNDECVHYYNCMEPLVSDI